MTDAPSERMEAIYVGIGVGAYKHFNPLPHALAEVRAVGQVLEGYRYLSRVIEDPTLSEAIDKIGNALPHSVLARGGSLIVLWSGHGVLTPEHRIHLIAKDVGPDAAPLFTAEYLAGVVARTGASQILLILDTCYSGGGTISALAVANQVLGELPPDARQVWVGVVASALEFERARDGVFGARLVKLLRDGPTGAELRLRWSAHSAGVRGDDVIDAMLKEWDVPGQRPKDAMSGDAWVMFPNPRYDPNAPERVVEHLLLAARGVEPGEEGSYFTGRTATLERIVAWMRRGEPGSFVLTGPAGSGKSAIIGRVVSLSNPTERTQRLADGSLEHRDPGKGSVHAHVHARGITAKRVVEQIDEQLARRGVVPTNRTGPRNRGDLQEAIERSGMRPFIAVDGLDEAGSESWRIASDVILPLAQVSLVLVSTRDLLPPGDGLSLVQTMGPREIVDLSDEAGQEDTRSDVLRYVEKRLANIAPPSMDRAKVGQAIVQLAREQREGVFLLARVVTAQLRADPIDTSQSAWQSQLSRSVEAAFERDLSRIPQMLRGNLKMPRAARELLTALAWGYGAGLPDDIWPIVATALSPTAATYKRDDVFWLLREAGRYVVEDGEKGRAVYRLSHKRFAEHLRAATEGASKPEVEARAASVALALVDYYLRLLAAGQRPQESAYLWRYAWRHCADAGQVGIEALRRLMQHDSEAFRPDLADALNSLGIRYGEVGRRQEALAPTEEAVSVYRELASTNPAFRSDLARVLNDLGIRYLEVGRLQEALAPTEEAVSVFRELAATDPAFRSGLYSTLKNLGSHYSGVGRLQEALAPTEEAVSVFRELAAANPAFRSELAGALNNLGVGYSEVGRLQEAQAPTEEAVSVFRELAATNPVFQPGLAKALNNLGIRYSGVGRLQEALVPSEEAVSVFRELAATNAAFRPDFGSVLDNLGIHYRAVGRQREALDSAEQAVSIFRELAATNPAFRPNLAGALNNLGIHYSGVGRRQEALAPTEEAVFIRQDLAATNPAFRPDLAKALNNLGIRYSEVGRRQEASAPIEEAVSVYREFAASNPAFRPDLAGALNNLGIRYSEVGRRQEALAFIEEAVSVFRESATNPAFRPEFGSALNNLGTHYRAVGLQQEALAPTEQAVSVFRELAASNPAFRPDLAKALSNLGNQYNEVGRRQEAVISTEEAVSIFRELAATNPAFRLDLARVLDNLGLRYRETERGDEVDDMWHTTITSLANPADRAFLLLRRAEAREAEDPVAIDDLLAAKSLAPDDDHGLIADVQSVCRQLRGRNASSFDREWRRRSGRDLPKWLSSDRD